MRKIVLPVLVIVLLFVLVTPAAAQDTLRVYYAGPPGGVQTALDLAGYDLVDEPAAADVLVLNGVIPDPELIAAQRERGAGLILVLGPDLTAEAVERATGIPVTFEARDDAVSLVELPLEDPLVREVIWNGAPQVRNRFEVLTPLSSLQPLVATYEDDGWVLWSGAGGQVFVFNAFLTTGIDPQTGAEITYNHQIQEWAYFNYLIYHLVERAAGRMPLSFADYPASPVPHAFERNLIFGLLVLTLATAAAAFLLVRRYSLKHPEALDEIVADRAKFEAREGGTEWEQVGFHRPLSGFLVALMLGLVMFIPLIIYQNLVLPVYILPSAQALGIWNRVVQFFALAWQFFDLGTSEAYIKFLAEYRVHDPKRGIKYGQMFIWWQALSGAVQVALVVAVASTLAPNSAYALYAWSVIIHALIQLPGFFQIFRHSFNGLQRLDYSRLLDIMLTIIPMVVQPLFVGIMFAWGRSHPVFGSAMGGLLGLGIAAYAAELLTFLLGLGLYRRIGFNVRILFLAHFDWDTIKTGFRFGIFGMLGSLAWAAGQAAEIAITQARLINYAEIWGNWGLAQNFVFAFQVIATLFDGAMASISEAISTGRRILAQYYSAMMYKYGGTISAFLGAVLLAVADRFILGASGPDFARGALYVIPLAIWGAIQYPSWVGDQVQLGSNRPQLKSLLVFGEQVIRIVLALVLVGRFQILGLIIAYFIGLLTKDIVAYFVNHRLCYPQRFYFWQSLAAPLLAGATHWTLLRWLTGYLWQADQISSVLIFFIGVLPSFPVFMFLYGLFGGWDDATLAELKLAADLTGFVRPLAWVAWASSALGARLSPLHGRFPINNRPPAMEEALTLTQEKVRL
ncbi:MAG: lipopolysaccharide biosynthesis protein [Anaerolineales bacterium]|nr:lipopolysaccharide biosynthesis protein [Anaerolineales bacterium]